MGVELLDLDTLLAQSDFVCVCCALTPATHHLLNAERLARMKPSAFFVNVARGPIVDQRALTDMLRERRIAGAGLDVFEKEPIDADDPLLTLDNVILAPHAICWTDELFRGNGQAACRSILEVASGRVPVDVVNRDALARASMQQKMARYASRLAPPTHLVANLSETVGAEGKEPLIVFCQDSLDYDEALQRNRAYREAKTPWIWVCTGALNRAYVSPLFLPDAGPCFACLLQSFQRLSPAPEMYDALRQHAQAGRPIAAVDFPYEGLLILQGVLAWKLQQAEAEQPDPGLYRLHVLERAHFEVSTHRVFADPTCRECGRS
jgi:bacteriocin biosynthesis cyclodehydratase domain-containing protein